MTTILECIPVSLRAERDHIAQFLNMNEDNDMHSPEMAHFFAQNIIARLELFSEN